MSMAMDATLFRGLRAWLPLAIAALLTMGTPGTALAQDTSLGDIRIALLADRSELTVGDPISLTLEVTHPEDHIVVVPRLDPDWGVFQVRRQTAANIAENRDGTEDDKPAARGDVVLAWDVRDAGLCHSPFVSPTGASRGCLPLLFD